jgi:hypothetical protein
MCAVLGVICYTKLPPFKQLLHALGSSSLGSHLYSSIFGMRTQDSNYFCLCLLLFTKLLEGSELIYLLAQHLAQ